MTAVGSGGAVALAELDDKLSEVESAPAKPPKKLNRVEKAHLARGQSFHVSYETIERAPSGNGCLDSGWLKKLPIWFPEDPLIQQADFVMLWLLAYTAIVTMYQTCFPFSDAATTTAAFWVDIAVMILFFLDIAIKFNVAYKDGYGNMVTSRSDIANNAALGFAQYARSGKEMK